MQKSTTDEASSVDTTANRFFKSTSYHLNQSNYDEAKRVQKPPYRTKSHFTDSTPNIFRDKEKLDKAWELYSTVVNSQSKQPAVLYKLRDLKNLLRGNEFMKFANGESLVQTGRQYCPNDDHCWDVNLA